MKLPAVKALVNDCSVAELKAAEEDLIEGRPLAIEVGGEDEGEQLTHIIAAIWVHNHMETEGADLKTALRAYTKKVRDSIS